VDILKKANIYHNEASRKRPIFIGVFLTPEGRNDLMTWWKGVIQLPFLEKVYANQLITQTHPTMQQAEQIQEGQSVALRITGWVATMQGQIVTAEPMVSIPFAHYSGPYPYITISTSSGVPRVALDRLSTGGLHQVPGPIIQGQLGVKWSPGF